MVARGEHGGRRGEEGQPPQPPAGEGAVTSAAAQARALVAAARRAALATLSDDGGPWASLVTYGVLADGSPVLVVSTMAEHGRNLARDPRASLMVAEDGPGDPLDAGRVTLAGRARAVQGAEREAALDAHPDARAYARFSDFTVWVLDVERVRWVGGFARMETVSGEDYRAAP